MEKEKEKLKFTEGKIRGNKFEIHKKIQRKIIQKYGNEFGLFTIQHQQRILDFL